LSFFQLLSTAFTPVSLLITLVSDLSVTQSMCFWLPYLVSQPLESVACAVESAYHCTDKRSADWTIVSICHWPTSTIVIEPNRLLIVAVSCFHKQGDCSHFYLS